jgi:aryl-alcohol dehydrogenase-like predicted oxidoreductase
MDYVDLIFCHRPDPHTPVEETVRAMDHVIRQGKAFYWGTSEWSAEALRNAYGVARREHLIPPLMEQPQYNMFHRERVEKEYLPLYDEMGLGTTIWSPLASGLLTGKYIDGVPDDSRMSLEKYQWLRKRLEEQGWEARNEKVKKLVPLAEELGATLPQMAIAWCLANPHVSTVITGASKPQQVAENMKALDVVGKLTPDVMERIEEVLQNKPQPELDWREL